MTPGALTSPRYPIFGTLQAVERPTVHLISSLAGAYVALLPFQVEVTKMLRIAPADIILAFACLLIPLKLRFPKAAWSPWHFALLAVFGVASLVTALHTGELTTYALLNKDIGLLVLFLSYILITSVAQNWHALRRIIRIFVISVVLQNLIGIAAAVAAYLYHINSIFMMDGLRLCGMLVDPNAYGGLLTCAFVLCETSSSSFEPVFSRPFVLFARTTLAVGLALTFSRTAWFSFAVALLGLMILNFRRMIKAALIMGGVVLFAGVLFGSRMLPMFETLATRENGGRVNLVEDAVAMFGQHPLIGAGLTAFQNHEGSIVHATFVWFLADFGLVGFNTCVGFMGWFLFKAWSDYRFAPARERPVVLGLLLGHIAMLALSFGIDAFYQRPWWLLFALIGSAQAILRRNRQMITRGAQR